MITNEVSVTNLLAYVPNSRHIRKGVLIRRIIASHLCTAVGRQQFREESRKLQKRIMFEHYYFFFHFYLSLCRYVLLQRRILSKPKWGARPPCPPHSDGTASGTILKRTVQYTTFENERVQKLTVMEKILACFVSPSLVIRVTLSTFLFENLFAFFVITTHFSFGFEL